MNCCNLERQCWDLTSPMPLVSRFDETVFTESPMITSSKGPEPNINTGQETKREEQTSFWHQVGVAFVCSNKGIINAFSTSQKHHLSVHAVNGRGRKITCLKSILITGNRTVSQYKSTNSLERISGLSPYFLKQLCLKFHITT